MPHKLTCPLCKSSLTATDDAYTRAILRKSIKCPNCHERFPIELPPATPEDPHSPYTTCKSSVTPEIIAALNTPPLDRNKWRPYALTLALLAFIAISISLTKSRRTRIAETNPNPNPTPIVIPTPPPPPPSSSPRRNLPPVSQSSAHADTRDRLVIAFINLHPNLRIPQPDTILRDESLDARIAICGNQNYIFLFDQYRITAVSIGNEIIFFQPDPE